MSEDRTASVMPGPPGAIRSECFLEYGDECYQPPEPSEVRAIIQRLGMSSIEVASFVGVSSARTVRKWQADEITTAAIPYAAWRLLVLELYRRSVRFTLTVEPETPRDPMDPGAIFDRLRPS